MTPDTGETAIENQAIDNLGLQLEGNLGLPFTAGNQVEVLKNGTRIFPRMLEAIQNARESIEFLTYIYWGGEVAQRFADALSARAAEGVRVRVLLDAWGAKPIPETLLKQMRDAGADVRWFRPMRRWQIWKADNRTHRKVLICDNRDAFTGGVGIASEWEGDARGPNEWRETHLAVQGPAIHGLRGAFLSNWAATGKPGFEPGEAIHAVPANAGTLRVQILRATGADSWNDMATLMHLLVSQARQRLRITSPYFVPNKQLKNLLVDAAQRGVEVQILVPGPYHDQPVSQYAGQADFADLLSAGVRIWRYMPTMLHAKVITVDGVLGSVGSANFNQRSMRKDDEINLTALGEAFAAKLDDDFEQDLADSQETSLADWQKRGWKIRFLEWACQFIRPQT